jgi:hypothetical protein
VLGDQLVRACLVDQRLGSTRGSGRSLPGGAAGGQPRLILLVRKGSAELPHADEPAERRPAPFLIDLESTLGQVTLVGRPGTLDGRPLGWTRGLTSPGSDPTTWVNWRVDPETARSTHR